MPEIDGGTTQPDRQDKGAGEKARPHAQEIDYEVVAEMVLRLMKAELTFERERAAGQGG